jgi:DNA-binding IclR family transcriptional regulator
MSKIVERTLDFFELFAAEKRPLSLTDMTRLLGIPTSSCHDVIRALEARGYMYEIAPRAGYYPTRRLYDLCSTIIANDSIVLKARPLLEQASRQIHETCLIAKATDLHVVYLFVVEPENPVRYSVTAGTEVLSLHATSGGKAALSKLAPEALQHFLRSTELGRLTDRTITSRKKLVADIAASRERGWFLNQEESRIGVTTVSSTFPWNGANYIVTVAGPAERMEAKVAGAGKIVVRLGEALKDVRG